MGAHRQENYMSQDALCLGETLKILLYSGKIHWLLRCILLCDRKCRSLVWITNKFSLWHDRTANSLGHVWGVHIWHDNSGSSPNWYLKRVEVCEVKADCFVFVLHVQRSVLVLPLWFVYLLLIQVNRDRVKGRAWLFIGQCWLAASKGDGKVEIMLRVCVQGIGFMKV